MALTAPQQEKMDEAKATLAQIKSGLEQMQEVVYNSLSIQNVGGSHIYNLGQDLKPLFAKLESQLEAVETVGDE